jgi:hypothetical protein
LSDRAPWGLVAIGMFGLVISLTVVWGLVGSNWRWVRRYRARFGSPPTRDRARLLAAQPPISAAAVLLGLFTTAADPVQATPIAVAAIIFLVIAIGMGIYPDPFLPRWFREATGVRAAPAPDERAVRAFWRVVVLGLGAACVPIGLGMTQVPRPSAVGLAMAAFGGLGVVLALKRRRA